MPMIKFLHSRRARHVATVALTLAAALASGGLVACADSTPSDLTAPLPSTAASRGITSATGQRLGGNGGSLLRSQRHLHGKAAGDTTVTQFILAPDTEGTVITLGNQAKIVFPLGAGSVCDPATSGYGVATWDLPCAALTKPITITAKSWVDPATGTVGTDFSPELRFVPGQPLGVTIFLPEPSGATHDHIDWCSDGVCYNDGSVDHVLVTRRHGDGYIYRIIKHFSGYNVVVN